MEKKIVSNFVSKQSLDAKKFLVIKKILAKSAIMMASYKVLVNFTHDL